MQTSRILGGGPKHLVTARLNPCMQRPAVQFPSLLAAPHLIRITPITRLRRRFLLAVQWRRPRCRQPAFAAVLALVLWTSGSLSCPHVAFLFAAHMLAVAELPPPFRLSAASSSSHHLAQVFCTSPLSQLSSRTSGLESCVPALV